MIPAKLRPKLNNYFPGLFSPKMNNRYLDEIRSDDEKRNLESELPPDEIIDIKCIWAVEFYLPIHTKQLLASIEKLGWHNDDIIASASLQLKTWIQNSRSRLTGGGWLNLGMIYRPEDNVNTPGLRRAPLPHSVAYAFGEVYSLTSSITSIVMCFVLKDSVSSKFQEILNKHYKTIAKPLNMKKVSIIGPEHQKAEEIDSFRRSLRKDISVWLANNLPGMFSTDKRIQGLPTCELTTLNQANPQEMMEDKERKPMDWWSLLGFDHSPGYWFSDEHKLCFTASLQLGDEEKSHAAILYKEDDIPEEKLKMYGGFSKTSSVAYVHNIINSMLSRWALLSILSYFEKYLNNIRDSATFKYTGKNKSIFLFEEIGTHISNSINISAASLELNKLAQSKWRFEYDVEEFVFKRLWRDDEKKMIYASNIRSFILERSAELSELDKSVRDILIQYGSMIEARENISLQNRIKMLTIVLVAFTVVLILFGIMDHYSKLNKILFEIYGWLKTLFF